MNFRIKVILSVLSFLLMALAVDEFVELEQYFNARKSANFEKGTENIKFSLPKGTQGKIKEVKKFASGNSGLLIDVLNGNNKGEKVWVHFNTKDPKIKIYADEKSMKENRETVTESPKQGQVARTLYSVPALKEPKEPIAKPRPTATEAKKMAEAVAKIEQAQTGAKSMGRFNDFCESCSIPAEGKPPVKDKNSRGASFSCMWKTTGPWDICTAQGEQSPERFKFDNYGPSTAVPERKENKYRTWTFSFEDQARQDMHISVADSPDGTISHIQDSYIFLFPRKILPSVKQVGNHSVVTLPTGETMTFDQNKNLVAGVFKENGKMASGSHQSNPAQISYSGQGVMVKANGIGDEPRMKGSATITKGTHTCTVPKKDLWPDQSESSAFHFKFTKDEDFDKYIKEKCGFGL